MPPCQICCQQNRLPHTGLVRLPGPRDVIRRSMVYRRADERRAQGQGHTTVEMVQFERNKALVMIHAHDRVIIAARSEMKETIGGKRSMDRDTIPLRRQHGRTDDLFFFSAENTLFAAVRIERCGHDARPLDAEILPQSTVGQLERRPNTLTREPWSNLSKAD